MSEEANKVRMDALAFLKKHKTGVLATAGHDNLPHASAVHYIVDDQLNVYFVTLTSSRKFQALSAHPQVAFTVLAENIPQTVQIEGMAQDISLSEEASGKRAALQEVFKENPYFDAPYTKLDPATVAIIWIKPTWVRWADYAFSGEGSERVLHEVEIPVS